MIDNDRYLIYYDYINETITFIYDDTAHSKANVNH